MNLHIVLLEPEIPQNTGNIARTCVAAGITLHLIKPYGFELSDKQIKRAGLDYWKRLNYYEYEHWEDFLSHNKDLPLFYVTTKATQTYADVNYPDNSAFVFGKESKGIPEEILVNNREKCIRIPMVHDERSLNLSNSVAIIAYDFLRQKNFEDLEKEGELHRLQWE